MMRVSLTGRCASSRLAAALGLCGVVVAGTGCRGTIGATSGARPAAGAAGSAGGGTTGAGGTATGAGGAAGGVVMTLVPGRSPLRRLSRVEYDNTVRDLLGDKTQPALSFEPDVIAEGFTNNADTQNVGTSLAQQYLTAAEALAVNATKDLVGLMGCDATAAAAAGGGDACVRAFVTRFGQRAWRRPLVATEVDTLDAVYATARADFDVPTSMQTVLEVMLTSPNFLYRVEHGVKAGGATIIPLTSWELASRLSYFLLGSMPDDALFSAAAADELKTSDQIAAQARRLLAATDGA